jgi:hypothetical protein
MRVVAFAQELDDPGHLGRALEEEERKCGYGCSANIVRGVGYSNMKEFSDCTRVSSTGICQSKSVYTSISEEWVLTI